MKILLFQFYQSDFFGKLWDADYINIIYLNTFVLLQVLWDMYHRLEIHFAPVNIKRN